jgi:hypothetical protein
VDDDRQPREGVVAGESFRDELLERALSEESRCGSVAPGASKPVAPSRI